MEQPNFEPHTVIDDSRRWADDELRSRRADSNTIVIAGRYEDELPTVFTSGYPKDRIKAMYGDAIARRLASPRAARPILVELFR